MDKNTICLCPADGLSGAVIQQWGFDLDTFLKLKQENRNVNADELILLSTTGSLNTLVFHLSEDKYQTYCCEYCVHESNTFYDIRQHLKECHSITIHLACPYCKKEFVAAAWLEKHIFGHVYDDLRDIGASFL